MWRKREHDYKHDRFQRSPRCSMRAKSPMIHVQKPSTRSTSPPAFFSNRHPPPPPPPPRPAPQPHRNPARDGHAEKSAPIALAPVALLVKLPIDPDNAVTPRAGLVNGAVHGPPHGGPPGGDHGDDAPVRAEVLDAPDDGDDDRGEGEDGAVAEADEGGDEREEMGGLLD